LSCTDSFGEVVLESSSASGASFTPGIRIVTVARSAVRDGVREGIEDLVAAFQ
jgi:hypothetical protein